MLPFIFYCSWFLKITFRKFYILIIKEGCYRTPLFDTPLPPPHPLEGVKLSKTTIANLLPAKAKSSVLSLFDFTNILIKMRNRHLFLISSDWNAQALKEEGLQEAENIARRQTFL